MNMRDRLANVIGTKLLEFEQWELTKGEAMEIADAVLDELMTPTEAMADTACQTWFGEERWPKMQDQEKYEFRGDMLAALNAMAKAAKDGK